jgi:xanthine dehydrogenase large subunit
VINIDAKSHVRGESIYLDDIPLLEGTLFACVYDSPIAHGKIKSVDISEAEKCAGVVKTILPKDIVGRNEIGGIIEDEPLLADGEVHFCGMPIAIVVAETDEQARHAAKQISADIEPLEVITDECMIDVLPQINQRHQEFLTRINLPLSAIIADIFSFSVNASFQRLFLLCF